MKRTVGFAAISLACLAAACSGAPSSEPGPDYELTTAHPPKGPTGGSKADPPSSPTPADTQAPPAGGSSEKTTKPPVVYSGTSASTATVPFGGTPYCSYDVTLENVQIDVGLLESGDVDTATVKNRVIEAAPNCPYPPAAPADQSFSSSAQAKTSGGGIHVDFAGAKTNTPATSLVVDVAPKGTAYEATLTWTRTDQPAPLAWKVTTKVTLAKK